MTQQDRKAWRGFWYGELYEYLNTYQDTTELTATAIWEQPDAKQIWAIRDSILKQLYAKMESPPERLFESMQNGKD